MSDIVQDPAAGTQRLTHLAAWTGLFYLALISLPTIVSLPGNVAPGQLLFLAMVPVWAAASLSTNVATFDKTTSREIAILLSCIGLVILLSFLSAFVALKPFRVSRWVLSFFTAFGMFLLINGTATRSWISRFLFVECLMLALVCLVTVLAPWHAGLMDMIYMGADRASGFFKNPNQFGIAVSTLLPVAVASFLSQRRKVVWGSIVILLILGLITSGSKTNLLISSASVLLLLVVFSLIAYQAKARAGMLLFVVSGYALAVVGFVTIIGFVNPRALALLKLFLQGGSPHSLVSRGELWDRSFELFQQNPLLGVGAGQHILPHISHSHNILIEAARAMGAPGLVLVSVFLMALLFTCFRTFVVAVRAQSSKLEHRMICIGSALGATAYMVANFVSDSFGPTTSPFLYSVLFLGMASRKYLNDSVGQSHGQPPG